MDNRLILAKHIFKKEGDSSLLIFLCGMKLSAPESKRAKIRNELIQFSRNRIAYPEMLFSDTRSFVDDDMLELERKLASWVDVIVIPLESPATLVELGAFCVIPELVSKILIFNEIKFKHDKSFINVGPLKAIQKKNKDNIYWFENDSIDDHVKEFSKKISSKRKVVDTSNLENIFNLARLVRIIIAIYQPIHKRELFKKIIEIDSAIEEKFIQACIDHLHENNQIIISNLNAKSIFRLSKAGFDDYIQVVERCQSLKRHVESRAKSLRRNYTERKEFKGGGAKKILAFGNTKSVEPVE